MKLPLAAFAVYATVALATGDFLNERDSDARYMGAKWALGHPAHLLDPWHKPAVVAPLALVIAIGGGAIGVKLWQAALAAAALELTRRAAVKFGAREREALLAAALAGLAPFWVRGVASALTETTCALFLAAALFLWSRERFAWSGLVTSFAFLARFDAVFFWAAWTPFLVKKKSWGGLACLPAGPVLWHLAGWAATGDPRFLVTHQPHAWGGSEYGSGPWWTFLALLPVSAGLLVVPAAAGLRRAPPIVAAVAGAVLAGHSILRAAGLFGSWGLPRYLVPMIPALAVAAAFGFETLAAAARAPVFAVATAAALLVAWYRPNAWTGAERLSAFHGALTDHSTVARLSGGDWKRVSEWRSSPPGTLVIWQSLFGGNPSFDEIPKERREPVWSLRLPARRWAPWEREWEGKVYRLR